MKIVIFGLGSIGRRHARILRDGFSHKLYAFRGSKGKPRRNELGITEIYSWRDIEDLKPDVAFITNPTFLHIQTALRCASLGMHLFIEKPLSHDLKDVARLESLCRKKRLTCYVAYCLRFHPIIKELHKLIKGKKIYHVRVCCSSYLPSWRKATDSRGSYSGIAKQGGGVLLDLSHEIDYIKYLFGPINKVTGVYGKISRVSNDAEDFADVLLNTSRAPHVNLHLNFLSMFNERRIIIDHKDGYIMADLLANKIEWYGRLKKKIRQFHSSRDDYLREQTKYFFDNIGDKAIMNGLKESKSTLTSILEFKNHG